MTMRIIFSNTTGEFVIQTANKDYLFKATSGRDECMNNKDCEDKPYIGPTPQGKYYLITNQLNDPAFLADVLRRTRGDWGDYRVPIYPQAGTNTHGRDNMFLHGGGMEGSAGCIDISGGILGDKNSDKIKELIKANAAQGVIRVDVINSRILEFHKNQPRDVVLPKELISELPNYTITADNQANGHVQFFAEYTSTDRYKNFEKAENINEEVLVGQLQKEQLAENEK